MHLTSYNFTNCKSPDTGRPIIIVKSPDSIQNLNYYSITVVTFTAEINLYNITVWHFLTFLFIICSFFCSFINPYFLGNIKSRDWCEVSSLFENAPLNNSADVSRTKTKPWYMRLRVTLTRLRMMMGEPKRCSIWSKWRPATCAYGSAWSTGREVQHLLNTCEKMSRSDSSV